MKKLAIILCLAACIPSCSELPAPIDGNRTQENFRKGMTLACWDASCYNTASSNFSMDALSSVGNDWVAIVTTAYQSDVSSGEIIAGTAERPARRDVERAIIRAHDFGYQVMLKPHIDIYSGVWRGEIQPNDRDKWFASYREYILDLARLAQMHEVALFAIGTELVGINRETAFWRDLISQVRQVYDGELTYAASWNEYQRIAFWRDLDFVGINAYFPLTSQRNPSQLDLYAGWQFWLNRLEGWQDAVDMPVLFTEIGYTTRDGTNMRPFEFTVGGDRDPQEQADCYEAALRISQEVPWLQGMFWWYWPMQAVSSSRLDDYSPMHKPAAEILERAWAE